MGKPASLPLRLQCRLPGRCVSADAATDFTAFGVLALPSSLPAFEATAFEVFSLCATVFTPSIDDEPRAIVPPHTVNVKL